MRDFTSELLRREIPRPLHPRPLHPRPHGRAALVAAGPCAALNQHPTHGPATRPPRHGPAREVPEPPSARGVRTGLPRWFALTHEDPDIGRGARPARPPAPHARARLGCWTPRRVPCRGRAAGDVGPYHCPTRTHLAPTIVPPAPTWPLPLSHPHPLGLYHSPTRTHSVPTLALQRPGARSTRAALGAGRPLSPTPCVHPMRVPCAAKLPPKNLIFFVIEGCRWHTFMCRASRGYAPRPIKQGESGVSGGVCAACIFFFSRPPCAYGGCVVYSWRL